MRLRELEHDNAPAGTHDPHELGEAAIEVGEVARAEADSGRVKAVGGVGQGERVGPLEADRRRLRSRAFEHRLGEVAADDLPRGADAACEREREVPRPRRDVEHALAGRDAREINGALAPAVMQPRRHDVVHHVIEPRDAVEHRPHLSGLQRAGSLRLRHYFRSDRKATIAENFFGDNFLNEGIGAVGFTSVRAIPFGGSRDAMCVSTGPGPALPLPPIV